MTFQEKCIALLFYYQPLQQLLEILFVELILDQHLELFFYLNQLKLGFNCLLNMHNLINILLDNIHLVLLILFLLHYTVLLNH